MTDEQRLDIYKPWPEGYKAMAAFDRVVAESRVNV